MAKKEGNAQREVGLFSDAVMPRASMESLLGAYQSQSNGQAFQVADGMTYLQLPTLDAAKQKLLELQGLGYKGYIDPYGNDIYGHEIRIWKDPNVPSMNPNKPSGNR